MILRGAIRDGDTVIDATAGNGHDTVFLAECVGENGRVLAFDVQESAIVSTRTRVGNAGVKPQVELHQASHTMMMEHAAPGSVSAIMFNLGYLPGENHNLTTEHAATIEALEASAVLLKAGGVISVVCYPGHDAGAEEAIKVEQWMNLQAGCGWRVAKYAMLGTLRPAPFLLVARKA
jgi:predicted methyltransferase